MFAWNKKITKESASYSISQVHAIGNKASVGEERKKEIQDRVESHAVFPFFPFFLFLFSLLLLLFFLFFFIKLGSSYAFAVTRSGSIVVCITGSVPGRRAILYPLLIPPPPPLHLLPLPLHLLIHPLCR